MENKKLVVTIATGGVEWGNKALNLALSVKAGLQDDSGIDIGVIYTATAFDGIEPLRDIHFDWGSQIADEENPVKLAFETKTKLYGLILLTANHYERILFMDADSIMLPGRSVTGWFDELKGSQFQAYTNDVLYYGPDGNISRSRYKDRHTAWCNPKEVYEKMKVSFLPQIDASFIYFEKSQSVESLFISANSFYLDSHTAKPHFKPELYKGLVLSEMCFNLALAIANHLPCKTDTWRPIFFEAFGGPQNFYHIQQEYNAFGFAGINPPSSGLLAHYNKLSDYYRDFFGVIPKYRAVQKQVELKPAKRLVAKSERPIYGYWHIACMGNWLDVVEEQLKLLIESGLYAMSQKIFIGIAGCTTQDFFLLQCKVGWYKKFEVGSPMPLNIYEFGTIDWLHKGAKLKHAHYGFYIHTKGVSDPRGKHWRDYLNHFNVTQWKDALAKLHEGYDLCGVKLLQANGAHVMHYSGNFFWYDSEYIKKLCDPMTLDTKNRYQAEFWVCSAEPEAATLSQKMIDHFNHEPFI